MLKIIMEDMNDGEVAAMYQHGQDAVILVSRALPDDVRCEAVNDLLAGVRAEEIRPKSLARLLFSVA